MKQNEENIGIVILNYNSWTDSANCVKTIVSSCLSYRYQIYIVDNRSSEFPAADEKKYLEEKTFIIEASQNRGYAAGNNIGIERALKDGCDYILICNSDILFARNDIENMVSFFQKQTDAGIVAPSVYDMNGNFHPFYFGKKATYSTIVKNILLKTPARFFLKKFEKEYIEYFPPDVPLKRFSASGCCFVASRECMQYLYPLDENTFLYEEENIIGCVLEKSKFSVYVIPNTHVVHLEGNSTKKASKFSRRCFIESEQYYLKEYLNASIFKRGFLRLFRFITLGV